MKHIKRILALFLILLLTLAGMGMQRMAGSDSFSAGPPPSGDGPGQKIPYEPDAALPPVESYRADPVDFAEDEATGLGYVKNLAVVYFDKDATAEQKNRAVAAVGGVVVGRAEAIGKWSVLVPGKTLEELRAVCAALEAQPGVTAAMEDHVLALYSQAVTTNDPWTYEPDNPIDNRWYMDAIEAPEAWEFNSLLAEQPRVGMVDEGVLTTHEELSKIVTNLTTVNTPEEFGGHSYTISQWPTRHGTAVASLIAAKADNGVGIAGLCWNAKVFAFDWNYGSRAYEPDILLVPPDPNAMTAEEKRLVQASVVLDGVLLCVQNGARAVNISMGAIPNGSTGATFGLAQSERDIYAASTSQFLAQMLAYSDTVPQFRRFVVVQSAGNQKSVMAVHNGLFACVTAANTGQSPEVAAKIMDMILIAGAVQKETTGVFKQWDSTTNNYNGTSAGTQVSIYAPGANILSAANGIDSYYKDSGTSYATPLVSGTAALMSAANPNLMGWEIGAMLKSAEVSPRVVRDRQSFNYTLYPMLNAKLALRAALALILLPGEGSDVAVQENYITHIDARTTAAALLADLRPKNGVDTILYPKAAATPDAWAATGDVITIKDSGGGRTAEYTVIVEGDVSGDGRVNAFDSQLLDMHLDGMIDLAVRGEEFLLAADFDMNGIVDHEDRKLMAWAGVME